MPRKNKEEYNKYMKDYMKKKSQNKREAPVIDGDFDPSSSDSGKPALDINKAGELIRHTQDLLKNKGSDTEEDPILKAIDKYGKYIPLAMKFFEGLKGSVSNYNQQDQTPKIQPPAGWVNATAMQKLGWKYTRSDWTAAGEAYDAAMDQGYTNPQVNIDHVDPNYIPQSRRPNPPQETSQPQSLSDLSRKYPQAPRVETAPQPPQQTPHSDGGKPCDPPIVKAEDSNPSVEEKAEVGAETKPTSDTPIQEDQLVQELQQDNLKYINMGSEFINDLTDEDFTTHLKNIDKLVEKAKVFMPMIPIHVKGMIIQTSKEDLEELFKEKCPKKFKILEKEKLKDKLLELFAGLQKIISEDN